MFKHSSRSASEILLSCAAHIPGQQLALVHVGIQSPYTKEAASQGIPRERGKEDTHLASQVPPNLWGQCVHQIQESYSALFWVPLTPSFSCFYLPMEESFISSGRNFLIRVLFLFKNRCLISRGQSVTEKESRTKLQRPSALAHAAI